MDSKFLLKKTCSIYASDLHFATMIFPFVVKELKCNTLVKTILEKNELQNISKILENIGLNDFEKEKIKTIDWHKSSVNKIKACLGLIEKELQKNTSIDLLVCGSNFFVEKVNKVIDLWLKNNLEKIENSFSCLNIINCYSFDENFDNLNFINSYDYILRTAGIEEIYKEELKEAN